MTPSIPATLCDPFEGARLLCTARITGIFGALVPANARLIAGEIGSTERRRFLTVTGRSPLGVAVEVNVWADDWDKLILLLDSPLAMCHAARWLATQLGCDPGATAPGWVFVPVDHDGMGTWTPAHFRLVGPDWIRVFTEEEGFNAQYFFGDSRPILRQTRSDAGVEAYDIHPWHPTTVPGILGMGPAAALAAACVAVGGAS